jgi:branched-chain amino acid transport system ATP-binding protein
LANSLTIENLHAAYGAVSVLSGVSLSAAEGETVVLLGTNGNGKSTLIKCLTGQLRPTQGRIVATIDGQSHDLVGMPAEKVVDLGISLVPEGRRLFPRLTVEENLMLGALRHAARPHIKRSLDFCFEAFPRLLERRRQPAGSMSGGEQQMLALGRAIMSSPRILVVDEPSVGLAPMMVARTMDNIAELKKTLGLTVLMAEQNLQQAIRIADRGYVLVHGEIVFTASSPDELRQSDMIQRLYLGLRRGTRTGVGADQA